MPPTFFMRRAIDLAEGRGRYAAPNPKVGAVLVKGGRVVGEGAHELYGRAHAEVNALKAAGARARGATAYVTLEPCSHRGKTPPCADALIAAGVKRVVAASLDPNPLVRGEGFAKLRAAGVKVSVGLLEKEARALNPAFLFSQEKGRPWVLLKAAVSLDGKLATRAGRSRWITNAASRRRAHGIRSQVDAILVGSGTALKDRPRLSVRLPGWRRSDGWPLRVLLDSTLRVPASAPIFQGAQKTLVFCSLGASKAKEKALARRGGLVLRVPRVRGGLSLKEVLARLQGQGVRSLMVEGGAKVHGSFLDARLADEVALFLAPKLFGGRAPGWVGGLGSADPERSPRLTGVRLESLDGDHLLTGKVRY